MERKIGIGTNVGGKFYDDSGNIIDEIYKSRLLSDIDSNEILIDGKCFESLNFKVDSIIYVILYFTLKMNYIFQRVKLWSSSV